MSRQYVEWAAGFFDGEGCISLGRRARGPHYTLGITAFQTAPAPLYILADLFGGSVHHRPRMNGWVWLLTGPGTIVALEELLPHLIVKRAQAELAILFQRRKTKKGGKYADPESARALDQQDHTAMRVLKLQLLDREAM